MTILIINNYIKENDNFGAKNIEEALSREEEKRVVIWHFSEIGSKELPENLKAIVLSGSQAHLYDDGVYSEYRDEVKLMTMAKVPILGICFGHQLIGKAFGANINSLPRFIDGFQNIKVVEPNEIFKTWKMGDELSVRQSHKDFVENVPPEFILLAESKNCKVEAMKHKIKPIYGIQGHIEKATDKKPDGYQIIRNFLKHVVETNAPHVSKR